MKVEIIKQKKEGFRPFDMSIRFETIEEAYEFYNIFFIDYRNGYFDHVNSTQICRKIREYFKDGSLSDSSGFYKSDEKMKEIYK